MKAEWEKKADETIDRLNRARGLRKITQIQLQPGDRPCLFVLCEDGTVWAIQWWDGQEVIKQIKIPDEKATNQN